MKQVGVFVNVSDLYYAALGAFNGGKINYKKYLERAVGNDTLYRAFAYGVQMGDEAGPFISALKQYGFEPKYKQARIVDKKPSINDTDWNVGIACDVFRIIDRIDTIILGTNDPNLTPLVEFVRDRGVKCVIYACNIPEELRYAANSCIELDFDVLSPKKEAV